MLDLWPPASGQTEREDDVSGEVDSLAVALDLIRRGIRPVPVPYGKKGPTIPQWQHLVITKDNAFQYFNDHDLNVGAIMGPSSQGLTDVDLDCQEAVDLAPHFLPKTGMVYGRKTKPMSHYLYTCDDPLPKAVEKYTDENKAVIVEIRFGGGGKGAQSVMPGSLHTSGERYEWHEDGQRAKVTCSELRTPGMKIAVGTLLLRHWPKKGARHETVLVLGGFLARAGWQPVEIEYFVETICTVHGEADDPQAHAKTARDSAERHQEGGNVYGIPAMIECFNEPVVRCIAKLLNYREGEARHTTAEGLEKDARGRLIFNSQNNIRRGLELMGVSVRYDSFHDQMLVSGLEGFSIVNDDVMNWLRLSLDERFHLLPNKEFFYDTIKYIAMHNSFHPVKDYLDNLVWDGVKRLDRWLVTYGGAEDSEYVRAVGSITLIAAVRRVRQPGVKFDEMLILESKQGLEKSVMLGNPGRQFRLVHRRSPARCRRQEGHRAATRSVDRGGGRAQRHEKGWRRAPEGYAVAPGGPCSTGIRTRHSRRSQAVHHRRHHQCHCCISER
jgi:Virulence-associated protein E/Bifunctional DNA primase/polymerase, N-terminal